MSKFSVGERIEWEFDYDMHVGDVVDNSGFYIIRMVSSSHYDLTKPVQMAGPFIDTKAKLSLAVGRSFKIATSFEGSALQCDHDIKIYDSGWTREEFCTKCTYKRKL